MKLCGLHIIQTCKSNMPPLKRGSSVHTTYRKLDSLQQLFGALWPVIQTCRAKHASDKRPSADHFANLIPYNSCLKLCGLSFKHADQTYHHWKRQSHISWTWFPTTAVWSFVAYHSNMQIKHTCTTTEKRLSAHHLAQTWFPTTAVWSFVACHSNMQIKHATTEKRLSAHHLAQTWFPTTAVWSFVACHSNMQIKPATTLKRLSSHHLAQTWFPTTAVWSFVACHSNMQIKHATTEKRLRAHHLSQTRFPTAVWSFVAYHSNMQIKHSNTEKRLSAHHLSQMWFPRTAVQSFLACYSNMRSKACQWKEIVQTTNHKRDSLDQLLKAFWPVIQTWVLTWSEYCIRHNFRVQIFSQFWTWCGNLRGLNFTIFLIF